MSESNDGSIVAITSDEEDDSYSDKPIIKLFKRLIANDSKQNTILTNSQILDLLKLEFNIDVLKLHPLEIDILISLMKKFLKDWPKWGEFDAVVNKCKLNNDMSEIGGMLQEKHKDLREYLQKAIVIAKPFTMDAVSKAKSHSNSRNFQKIKKILRDGKLSDEAIVLEIDATRSQLNSLILKRPLEGSIFNNKKIEKPKSIGVDLKTEAILNFWNVNFELKVKQSNNFVTLYQRKICHELKHTLVNNKLDVKTNPLVELDQEFQVKSCEKSMEIQTTKLVFNINEISTKTVNKELPGILLFIKKDLCLMPKKILTHSTYKRYLNRYSYVRSLYEDGETRKSNKHDLHIEEVLIPTMEVFIADFDINGPEIDINCVFLQCATCGESYSGSSALAELKMHLQGHTEEPPFNCSNCKRDFTVVALSENWWCHKCDS